MSVYRTPLQVLFLILLLLAGQLQAKNVCTCTIMDKNVHGAMMDTNMSMQDEKTCSNENKILLSLDSKDKTSIDTNLCCKKIVALSDIQVNVTIPDLFAELDIDPPQEKLTTLGIVFPLRAIRVLNGFSHINPAQFGFKIHLITQRLRI